jgi:phage terminase large subunit GpA-like protein
MRAKGPDLEEMFTQMRAELVQWRAAHPEASFDEIAAQITPRRQRLMGAWLEELALQHGNGYAWAGLPCPQCGEALVYKGTPEREVIHSEGEAELARAYYYCPHCKRGFFPPGSAVGVGTS